MSLSYLSSSCQHAWGLEPIPSPHLWLVWVSLLQLSCLSGKANLSHVGFVSLNPTEPPKPIREFPCPLPPQQPIAFFHKTFCKNPGHLTLLLLLNHTCTAPPGTFYSWAQVSCGPAWRSLSSSPRLHTCRLSAANMVSGLVSGTMCYTCCVFSHLVLLWGNGSLPALWVNRRWLCNHRFQILTCKVCCWHHL